MLQGKSGVNHVPTTPRFYPENAGCLHGVCSPCVLQYPPRTRREGFSGLALQLHPALVLFQKSTEVPCDAEQSEPLLIVQSHRKPPQSVDAHAPLPADLELQLSAFFRSGLPAWIGLSVS